MQQYVIALDLDGTLTNHNKEVTPRTRKALMLAMHEGAIIVLASGRPTYGIEPVAHCLELEKNGGYILSYNGGKIVDWATKKEIYTKHLPDDVVPLIYDYAMRHHYALLGYVGDHIVTEMPNDEYVKEESRINKMAIRQVEHLPSAIEAHPTKLLLTGHPDDMIKAEAELSDLLNYKMDVFRSAPFFVELVPKGIDKAQSLERLLQHLGFDATNLIAFGDGYNDLSMIKYANMGVAMANAAPELRAIADYVTLSNDEDGVAIFLEKLYAGALEQQ